MDTVIYHANCRDGFGAAMAAWVRLEDRARYVPCQYGWAIPDCEPGSHVYILDFSFPRAELQTLAATGCGVTVIDHHKTAEEALNGFPPPPPCPGNERGVCATFDMEKSGAVLAWEYFSPGIRVPTLLKYIQDRDLWRWKLPDSRAVSAGLDLLPWDFEQWWKHHADVSLLIAKGETVLEYQQKQVSESLKNARVVPLAGLPFAVVNTGVLMSEVCEALLKDADNNGAVAACCYFDTREGKRVYSLRSREGSDVDVSRIAKAFGGGGHKHAAGFTLNRLDSGMPS